MTCPSLSQDATSALGGWALTLAFLFALIPFCPWLRWLRKQEECRPLLSLMALFNFAQRAFRPWELWLGRMKGWVVLSGLLAFAGPFVYEAIKTPCLSLPVRGATIGSMVVAQTVLLLYGQGYANREQQAAEARLNEQAAQINSICLGVDSIGSAISEQATLLSEQATLLGCIADAIEDGGEEDP